VSDIDDRPQFSVAVFYRDGSHAYVCRWMHEAAAWIVFRNTIKAQRRRLFRVIITDGGDCTVAEWRKPEVRKRKIEKPIEKLRK
jgi:hypothetical protein